MSIAVGGRPELREYQQARDLGVHELARRTKGLQVGAEALTGLVDGAFAAIVVRLPLLVWAGTALFAVALLAATTRTREVAADPAR